MLVIKKAVYQYGFALAEQYKSSGLPEIAIAGKSNVGKSSFINMLTNNGGLAKVAQRPGKTRMINVFAINDAFWLMDLPGYGYAEVSRAERERFSTLIERYLSNSPQLKHVLLLLDIRHAPSQDDLDMLKWLCYYQVPFSIIATKSDKLSGAQAGRALDTLSRATGVIKQDIYPVSSLTRKGKDAVLARLEQVLANDGNNGTADNTETE